MTPTSAESWRLFVALPVPPAAAARLEASLRPYVARFPGARWLRPELLHVTLRFLGAVRSSEVTGIAAAMATGARETHPFATATTGGDGLMRRSDGVAWLRLGEGAATIRTLATRLAVALGGAGRTSEPHVTIARRTDAALIDALRTARLGSLATTWMADRVVLFRSHTGTPAGSSYEALAEVPL